MSADTHRYHPLLVGDDSKKCMPIVDVPSVSGENQDDGQCKRYGCANTANKWKHEVADEKYISGGGDPWDEEDSGEKTRSFASVRAHSSLSSPGLVVHTTHAYAYTQFID